MSVHPLRRFCATCATPLGRGQSVICSGGCGARLCRKRRYCWALHSRNCPAVARQYTNDPGGAA